MKTFVLLQKQDDGTIHCRTLSEEGNKYIHSEGYDELEHWESGGTILIDELDEILDQEI